MEVSFYQRHHPKSESAYMESCLSSDLKTDGFFMKRLTDVCASLYPGSNPLFTPSCTLALEMAMDCLDLHNGDEVILPSFNFPSAANAIIRQGGTPVLCDISPDTQNISVLDAENRITARTKAIVAVHYAGVACPMEALMHLSGQAGLCLIEDAAQAMGAYYREIPLGTIAEMGTISFHHTKNLTCGEGGLFLTYRDDYAFRASCYRLHGTDRTAYINGEIDRYTWQMPGSCTALSEPCAAVLASQFEALEEITARRRDILSRYQERLEPLERRGIAMRMKIPDYARTNGHIYYLRYENPRQCEMVREHLTCHGIEAKTHYVPLHISPMGQKLGYHKNDLRQSLACYETLLRLPIHTGLSDSDVDWICEQTIAISNNEK